MKLCVAATLPLCCRLALYIVLWYWLCAAHSLMTDLYPCVQQQLHTKVVSTQLTLVASTLQHSCVICYKRPHFDPSHAEVCLLLHQLLTAQLYPDAAAVQTRSHPLPAALPAVPT